MPDVLESAAPAQPESAPPVVSALDAAVAARDMAAFKAASHAERSGAPLDAPTPDVPAAPAQPAAPPTDPAATPERQVSKRQQQINDYERELATLRAENARLRTTAAPVTAPPKGEAPAPEKFEGWDAWSAKHPEASYDDYVDARADFRFEQRRHAEAREAALRTHAEALTQAQTTFSERIRTHAEAHPGYLDRIHPGLLNLEPASALRASGLPVSVHNVIADRLLKSAVSPLLLEHFTDHPEDYSRLTALSPDEFFVQMGQLEAALGQKAAPPTPDPKPVSRMTAPVTTLGTRSADPGDEEAAAVASGDVGRFKAIQQARRLAEVRR